MPAPIPWNTWITIASCCDTRFDIVYQRLQRRYHWLNLGPSILLIDPRVKKLECAIVDALEILRKREFDESRNSIQCKDADYADSRDSTGEDSTAISR